MLPDAAGLVYQSVCQLHAQNLEGSAPREVCLAIGLRPQACREVRLAVRLEEGGRAWSHGCQNARSGLGEGDASGQALVGGAAETRRHVVHAGVSQHLAVQGAAAETSVPASAHC